MFKQFILILPVLLIGITLTGSGNKAIKPRNPASSAVRNSNEFNFNKITKKSSITETNIFSEDFNLPVLRSNWSSKSNSSYWSLNERPGFLRLKSQEKDIKNFTNNTFSKKVEINSMCEAICQFDLTNLKEGNETGLYYSGKHLNYIQIKVVKGIHELEVVINSKKYKGPEINVTNLMFRTHVEANKAWFEYSLDGLNFVQLGKAFVLDSKASHSDNIGLFCFTQNEKGWADIDWFYFNQKKSILKYAELL